MSADSFDSSLEAELQMRAGRRQVEMESSIDIDDSYPPPARRMEPSTYRSGASGYGGGVGASGGGGGGGASRYSRATDTPSPEPSDVDVSLSASGDYGQPSYGYGQQSRQQSAISAASAYPARLSTARSTALGSSTASAVGARRDAHGRRSYADADSSLEDLNPDNEPEYRPYKPESYHHVSAHELLAQRAAALKQQQQATAAAAAASSHGRRAAPSRSRVSEEEEEVEIDLDSSADMGGANTRPAAGAGGGARPAPRARPGPRADASVDVDIDVDGDGEASVDIDVEASASLDVRASNNTLIRKAQAMQEDSERKEREQASAERERERRDRERKDSEAAAARERERERERIRLREEEEDRLEREEADRAREEMRRAAEVADEEEEYADEFADEPEKAPSAAAAARGGIDALTLDESAEDEEIERARRLLEAEEEAELAAERRAAELRQSTSSESGDTDRDPQLATAAFMPGSFGVRKAGPVGSPSARSLDDLGEDSADLDVARRRQEELEAEEAAEEEAAEQRRRAELAAKERQLAAQRRASIEDSYEDDEHPAQRASRRHAPSVPAPASGPSASSASAATAAPSATAAPAPSSSAASDSAGMPSVLAAALSTLNPAVSAMVMQAVQQQLANQTGQAPAAPVPAAAPNPYALYNPAPGQRHPSAVAFDPSQSRAAAAAAWERLLSLKSASAASAAAQVAPAPFAAAAATAPAAPFHGSVGRGPAPALPYPPAPPRHVNSWEEMLAQASSSQLARNTADTNKLFAKPAVAAGATGTPAAAPAGYGAPHYPPSSTRFDSGQFRSAGHMDAFIGQVLHTGVAEDRSRTHLRVESEREALRRLLAFEPYAPLQAAAAEAAVAAEGLAGPSPALARAVADQKALYVQDQAILNSVLRRVLSAGERAQGVAQLTKQNSLRFTPGANPSAAAAAAVSEGVADDGRPLPANDVIRMVRRRELPAVLVGMATMTFRNADAMSN